MSPVLPESFVLCLTCGRLIVRDALNPSGRCTGDCGDRAAPMVCVCGDRTCSLYAAVDTYWVAWSRHAAPYFAAAARSTEKTETAAETSTSTEEATRD